MRHLDLFSGAGGFALAAKWAGIETVGFCEIDNECLAILNQEWPNAKIHTDINELDGDDYRYVDIITGGYPCQPFSVAGSQKAQKDNRYLWPQMLRIIAQAKPTWAICENVYGHIKLGLDSVLSDLEAVGYATQSFVIPALATGGNHYRNRVFIVAYATGNGCNESQITISHGKANAVSKDGQNKNSNNERRSGLRFAVDWQGKPIGRRGTEPPPLRVDDELPRRAHRNKLPGAIYHVSPARVSFRDETNNKMMGNAIDPLIAYELMRCIRAM